MKVTSFVRLACSAGPNSPVIWQRASQWSRRNDREVAYSVPQHGGTALEVARFVAFLLRGAQAVRRRLCDSSEPVAGKSPDL